MTKNLIKFPRRFLAAASLTTLFCISHVAAGYANPGLISQIHFMSNGVVIFSTSGTRVGIPSCATAGNRWTFDGSTDAGKVRLAGLLAAHSAQKPIAISGTNTCNVWSDTETVDYFIAQ